MPSHATHLECTGCGAHHPHRVLQGVSPCCALPLYVRYDLAGVGDALPRQALSGRSADLWRYAELLPVEDPATAPVLGEGWTPLLSVPRLAAELGMDRLLVKEEGGNPTGSFKARGLALAVARAAELGAREVALPTAGNAGAAAAAYAARAGLVCHVFAPRDTSAAILAQIRALGARLVLVEGVITDCAARVREGAERHGWVDLSTLREPYRVEGKKTMGIELAEQLGWRLPDAILYPAGGGTGLVGMWKAFAEMEALGWIGPERPRMFAVQAAGCAPIVRAFAAGAERAEPWERPATRALGLRVPRAIGDFLMLRALRESGGGAVAVGDDEMEAWVERGGAASGIYFAREGAATLAALAALCAQGLIAPGELTVCFNTATGLTDPVH
jgi:threonine synthase